MSHAGTFHKFMHPQRKPWTTDPHIWPLTSDLCFLKFKGLFSEIRRTLGEEVVGTPNIVVFLQYVTLSGVKISTVSWRELLSNPSRCAPTRLVFLSSSAVKKPQHCLWVYRFAPVGHSRSVRVNSTDVYRCTVSVLSTETLYSYTACRGRSLLPWSPLPKKPKALSLSYFKSSGHKREVGRWMFTSSTVGYTRV